MAVPPWPWCSHSGMHRAEPPAVTLPPGYPGCPGGLLTSPKSRFRPKLLLQMLLARREGQKGMEGRRGVVPVPCRRPAGTHPMAAHPGALTMGPDPPARCRSASGGNLHPPGQQPRVREPPWGQQVLARGDHRGRAARTPHGLASPSRGRHSASGAVRQEGAKRRCRARAGEEGITYFRARRDRCCCAAAAFNPLCPPQRCRGVAEGVPGVRPALGAQLPLG